MIVRRVASPDLLGSSVGAETGEKRVKMDIPGAFGELVING